MLLTGLGVWHILTTYGGYGGGSRGFAEEFDES